MAKQLRKNPVTGCRPAQLFGLWFMDADRLETYRQRAVESDLVSLSVDQQSRVPDPLEGDMLGDDPQAMLRAWNRYTLLFSADDDRADAGGDGEPVQRVPDLDGGAPAAPPKPYPVANGVAVLSVNGPTTKYTTSFQSMFGGTSTVKMGRMLRIAAEDPDVRGVLMHFEDAPGGTVAGAYELRDEIRKFAKSKPIAAHCTDLCCSAAYLFASATGGRITSNETGFVGSIGTRSHLIDTSEKFAKEGVRVIPVASGKFKAAGLPGTKITDEHVAEAQKRIDELNDLFVNAVSESRGITPDDVRGLEARVFLAPEAQRVKLIDGVCSFEQALSDMQEKVKAAPADPKPNNGRAAASAKTENQTMPFIEQMRQLMGLPATASEAEILAAVRELQSADTSAADVMPAALAAGYLKLAVRQADGQVKDGKMSPVACAAIKQAAGWQEKGKAAPVPFMLEPREELGGVSVAEFACNLFEGHAPKGGAPKEGEKSGDQQLPDGIKPAADRVAPGSAKATAEELAEQARIDKAVEERKASYGVTAGAK